MSEDYDKQDDEIFNGVTPENPDELVTVEGEAETGFENVVEEQTPQTEESKSEEPEKQVAEAPTVAQEEENQGLPPAAYAEVKKNRQKRQAAEAALEEEKRAREAAQKELEALRHQPQQPTHAQQPQQQPQQPQIPNPATEPEAYHNYMEQKRASDYLNMKLGISETQARMKHGDELVSAAMQSLQSRPDAVHLKQQMISASDPYSAVVQWHQQQQLLSEIGDNPTAYKERLKQELLAEMAPQAPVQPTPQTATPQQKLPPRTSAATSAMPGVIQPKNHEDVDAQLWGR